MVRAERFFLLLLAVIFTALPAGPLCAQRHAAIGRLPGGAAARDAGATNAAPFTGSGRWLIIYIRADQPWTPELDQFLNRLHADRPTVRIVAVIDRPASLIPVLLQGHPQAGIREWHADEDHLLWISLAATGSPILLGMEDDRVIWRGERLRVQNRPLFAQIADWLGRPVPGSVATATATVPANRPAPH